MIRATIACFIAFCAYVSFAAEEIISYRLMGQHNPRVDFVQGKSSSAEAAHELVFAVKQHNLVELDQLLVERSTPGNHLYQQWLSFEEVGEMTSNVEGAKAVEDWLAENNIEVSWKTIHSDYIRATAKISQWEQMLNTKFYEFEDLHSSNRKGVIHRAVDYSLPEHIADHLHAVFNTVQVPPVMHRTSSELKVRGHLRTQKNIVSGETTVDLLNEFYGMNNLLGNSSMTQTVFATDNNFFSPQDLTTFQEKNSLLTQAAASPYGHTKSECAGQTCTEGNLDLQYIMGVAQNVATTYWYVQNTTNSDPFLNWVTQVANEPRPSYVNSMSWGATEQVRNLGLRKPTYMLTISY